MHFADDLASAVRRSGNAVCVGLDPRWKQLPESLRRGSGASPTGKAAAYEQFCTGICDVVAPFVPIVKLQAAFFEELGPPGMGAMHRVIQHAQQCGLLVIVDGKRNDIGSTAEAYARGYLGRGESAWNADAITVNPYLGDDSLAPFADIAVERGAGVFVLVKTSNPGGRLLQDIEHDGQPVYKRVAAHVEGLARKSVGECGYGSIGAVVGATFPAQLSELRHWMPHTWFLVPGFGSQGGTAADVVSAFDSDGLGAVINNSRGIIFAYENRPYSARFGAERWQEAVAAATGEMIDQLRSVVPG
jgi:orotidine-5'-phosphate decarboxylase